MRAIRHLSVFVVLAALVLPLLAGPVSLPFVSAQEGTPVAGAADDVDNDGVVDELDNCVDGWNTDQLDSDADGIGDACDATPFGDPSTNGDGGTGDCSGDAGNTCNLPSDLDGDGIPDTEDACPDDAGNTCNLPADSDGDGIPDDQDACADRPDDSCLTPTETALSEATPAEAIEEPVMAATPDAPAASPEPSVLEEAVVASAQAPGTITITVKDAQSSTPIQGATVLVTISGSDVLVATGVSGADGTVTTAQLPGGAYNITASRDGYLDGNGYAQVDGNKTTSVWLTQRTVGALNVTVLDQQTNAPIEGATVVITESNDSEIVANGATGGNGVFATRQLPRGNYYINVSHGNYQASNWNWIQLDGDTNTTVKLSPNAAGILTITVKDQQTNAPIEGATVQVRSSDDFVTVATGPTSSDGTFATSQILGGGYSISVSHSAYFYGSASVTVNGNTAKTITLAPRNDGTVTVTVLDAVTGMAISGATVRIIKSGVADPVASGSTGNDGIYASGQIATGSYSVEASQVGYATRLGYVTIGGNVALTLMLSPSTAGTITVTVEDAQTGLPISGASVKATLSGASNPAATGNTDSSGVLVTSSLTGGSYWVEASHSSYLTDDAWVTVNGDKTVTIRLKPNVPGTIMIVARSWSTGLPVAGATVVIRDSQRVSVATGTTDSNGVFTSAALPSGDYGIDASHPDYFAGTGRVEAAGDSVGTVWLIPHVDGTVTLTVRAKGTGALISGASVTINKAAGGALAASGQTDGSGVFASAQLASDDYKFTVTASGYQAFSGDIRVIDNASRTVWLQVAPPVTATPTPVNTATKTPTPVKTATKTSTPVNTATKTSTPVKTATKTPTSATTPGTGGFQPGDSVRTTARVNLRSGPSSGSSVLTVLSAGTICQVSGAAVVAGGTTWYPVQCAGSQSGYVAGSYLAGSSAPSPTVVASATRTPQLPTASPTVATGGFAPGDWVRSTTRLNLRTGAGVGHEVIVVLPTGASCQVTGPLTMVGSSPWYPIACVGQGSGYASGVYLQASTPPGPSATNTPQPPTASPTVATGGFAPGDWVRTTTRLNLRTGAGVGHAVIVVLPAGANCQVTGPRTMVGSSAWYPITCAGYGSGHVNGSYLKR